MKLILSRKGFDSSAGGVASPILPDGAMFSLPIPSTHSPIRYQDITLCGRSLGHVVPDLTKGRTKADCRTHFDPDLAPGALPRQSGWRGLFGQGGGEQKVLANKGVGAGDLFLFFGWFRRVEQYGEAFRFVRDAADIHVLCGWLQIDAVFDVARDRERIPSWASYHPHMKNSEHMTQNTLYVARERLTLDGVDTDVPGAGVFPRYDDRLRLTKPGASRSRWSLPAWFHPGPDRPPLGYHGNSSLWARAGDRVELKSVARGQEFVLDVARYPEALSWIREIVAISS